LAEAAVLGEHAEEVRGDGIEPHRCRDRLDGAQSVLAPDQRAGGELAQVRRLAQPLAERGEAGADRLELALVPCQFEQCGRIAARQTCLNAAGILHARLDSLQICLWGPLGALRMESAGPIIDS